MPAPMNKLDSEFNDEEKLEMADNSSEIHPQSRFSARHIFNIHNQTSTARELDNERGNAYARISRTHNKGRRTFPQPTTISGLPPTQGLNATEQKQEVICYNSREKDKLRGSVKNPRENGPLSTTKDKAIQMELKRHECVGNAESIPRDLNQEYSTRRTFKPDSETEIDDNNDLVSQYLLDTEAQNVPTEVSADTSDKISMIAILTDLQTQLDGHAKVVEHQQKQHQGKDDTIRNLETQKTSREWLNVVPLKCSYGMLEERSKLYHQGIRKNAHAGPSDCAPQVKLIP
ncbi:hypothetical protein Tco_1262849 [Tanacetum coccineum]|uniref:Uncharacterized protein n=1 Tax=Tanacetum coccineum TaxID=301880 RepID=A0ABQ5EVQ0_9ASTR